MSRLLSPLSRAALGNPRTKTPESQYTQISQKRNAWKNTLGSFHNSCCGGIAHTLQANGWAQPAQARPAVLAVAGSIILGYALLLVVATVGCLAVFARVENLIELAIFIVAGSLLLAMGTFVRSTRPITAVGAQLVAGFAAGLLILPSVSLLVGVIEGACASRSLPAERGWTALGLAAFTVSTLAGYTFVRFLETLPVPAGIRCG